MEKSLKKYEKQSTSRISVRGICENGWEWPKEWHKVGQRVFVVDPGQHIWGTGTVEGVLWSTGGYAVKLDSGECHEWIVWPNVWKIIKEWDSAERRLLRFLASFITLAWARRNFLMKTKGEE